jgi:hypothetical protein
MNEYDRLTIDPLFTNFLLKSKLYGGPKIRIFVFQEIGSKMKKEK